MYQWCNYCHRDAHYIIYYKSVHISGITLHSIPNLFAKLIFDSLMISNKESTRSIRTNIQNSFLKQKTYKSASTAILSRKRNHDSWLQCNESSKTNIYIHTHATRDIFFPLSRSCRWRVFSFISGRITNAKLITGERKSRGDKSRSVQPCWSTGSGEKLTSS